MPSNNDMTAIIKTSVSTVLYLGVMAAMIVCLYNVFLVTENNMSEDDYICKGGTTIMQYNLTSSSFYEKTYTESSCLDRFHYQHSLLYRHSYSSEISLWTSLGFSVTALIFLLFTSLVTCNSQCGGWQMFGYAKDYDKTKKGSCESSLFCCGAIHGKDNRPKFAWQRRAVFFTLAGGAIICLGISLALILLAFAQERHFVPQLNDESRKVVDEGVDSDIRRVDNLKALMTLHVIAIVLKVAWVLAVNDDQQSMQHVDIASSTPDETPMQEVEIEPLDENEAELLFPSKQVSFNKKGISNRNYIRKQLNY